LQYIGKLDISKLGEYKEKLITDEVVITEERIEHIKLRHPELTDKELIYLKEILKAPDYIFKDKKNIDTFLMVKNIIKDNKKYIMVVRLVTNNNLQGKSNTIISLWKISNKKLGQYIRNEEIIFKIVDKSE